MNKSASAAFSDDALLKARLTDAVALSRARKNPQFVGFLSEREGLLAERLIKSMHWEDTLFWGGYEGAERLCFGAFPDFMGPDAASFPVDALTVTFRAQDKLTHRDFLGTLMSLGINRDTVGDILIEDGRCVLFVRSSIVSFILSQLQKVGGAGLKVEPGFHEPLPPGRGTEPITDTIASARLDCVVAALTGLSREKSAGLITAGLVQLNASEKLSLSVEVEEGDKLSIRGYGKFLVEAIGPPTKKGRLRLKALKYL